MKSTRLKLVAVFATIVCAVGVFGSNANAASIIAPISARGFYGWGVTTVANASAAGAPAKPVITLTVSAVSAKPWDTGAGEVNIAPIVTGEKLVATFYARVTSPSTGVTDFSFEKASAPYTSSIRKSITLGKAWKKFTLPFSSAATYAPGQAHAIFHTGYAKYTIQVAGLTVTPGS